ncbi:MAG: serine/threonine-protein kinase [Planctomycetaceae bacterium]
MSEQSESQRLSRKILELAAARGILPPEAYQSVSSLSGDVCDHAIQRELISTSDVDMLRPLADPTEFLPGYEIEELLGQGAAGVVYRAKHNTLGRDVALKLLRSGLLDDASVTARSQLEARIGASLQHPGIVAVYDYGVHQQRVYLAMEFLSGESLEETIDRSGAIEPAHSLKMIKQVSAALKYANAEGVVHRDIKPANLMLTDDKAGISDLPNNKIIKVTDFGLAFNVQRTDLTRLTVAGATLGSPSYVAPEQLESTDVDQRADIFALGATLFHMVTGKQPFGTANVFKAIAAKMQGSDDWLDGIDDAVPNSVARLIRDMSRSNPDDRIQDYDSLDSRIAEILNGTASETPFAKPSSGAFARPWVRGLLAAGTIAVIGFGLSTVFPTNENSAPTNQTPPRLDTVKASGEIPLFDGFKLPDNRIRSIWRVSENAEGARVLEGTDGWMRFAIEPEHKQSGYFRFRIEVDTSQGAEVDVCFGFEPSGNCRVVHLQKQLAISGTGIVRDDRSGFGTAESDSQDFFKSSQPPLETPLDGSLNAIRIERQPNAWFVIVNQKQLTAIPAKAGDDSAIYVRTTGRAYFSDIAVVPLEPVLPDSK